MVAARKTEHLAMERAMSALGTTAGAQGFGKPVLNARRSLWLVAAGVVTLVAIFVSVARSPVDVTQPSGAGALARLRTLPLQAQGAISTGVGGGEGAFAPVRTSSGYRVSGGGVLARVGRSGVRFNVVGGAAASLSLVAVGRGARVHRIATVAPVARSGRVVLAHPGIGEWYAAGPLGVEQGFTVARRPAGARGQLVLSLRLGGGLSARRAATGVVFVSGSGRVVLRYGGLAAVDASGRRLPAAFALVGGALMLQVDDRGAVYPVRIDPFIEEDKLIPPDEIKSGGIYTSLFGASVAISSDGNTALIGGYSDNNEFGAAWVYTRSAAGVWSEQQKILPPADDTATNGEFGVYVALSGDGNTALIEAPGTAVWVFTRTGTSWAEQQMIPSPAYNASTNPDSVDFDGGVALSSEGTEALIGGRDGGGDAGGAWIYTRSGTAWSPLPVINPPADESGTGSSFGAAVALAGQGTTALIGGYQDGVHTNGSSTGAAWVYTLSGGTWTEQKKLDDPPGTSGGVLPQFGWSVSLSDDGSTALIGGPNDNNEYGSAWVYTRSGSAWTEQQQLTSPTDENTPVIGANFGDAVSLSSAGTSALISGGSDGYTNSTGSVGAVWLYTRSATGAWGESQKIVPTDESGKGGFGGSVALSGDGSTTIVGGDNDDGGVGAAWVYAAPLPPVVTQVGPSSGPAVGHTPVKITGANFTGATTVDFGTAAATSVSVVNSGEITATSPAGAGTVDVTVTTPVATSAKSAADDFTYLPALTCTLRAKTAKVAVPTRHGKPTASSGKLRLIAICDQAAAGTVTGSVTELIKHKHGRAKPKVVRLPTAHVALSAGVARTISVKVSKTLVVALEAGAKESAAFTLAASNANGSARATARIAKLKS